jgi:hypothetical protein
VTLNCRSCAEACFAAKNIDIEPYLSKYAAYNSIDLFRIINSDEVLDKIYIGALNK